MNSFFKNLKINLKILIGFSIISILLFVIGIYDYTALKGFKTQNSEINHNMRFTEYTSLAKQSLMSELEACLKISASKDIRELERIWDFHQQNIEDYYYAINSFRFFANSINDQQYFRFKRNILNTAIEVEEDYKKIVLPSFDKIRSTKTDLINNPGADFTKPVQNIEPIITIDQTDNEYDGTTLGPVSDDNQEIRGLENFDFGDFGEIGPEALPKTTEKEKPQNKKPEKSETKTSDNKKVTEPSKTIENTKNEKQIDQNKSIVIESTDGKEIFLQPKEDFTKIFDQSETDLRVRTLLEITNYIESTAKKMIKKFDATERIANSYIKELQKTSDDEASFKLRSSFIFIVTGIIASILIALLIANIIAKPIRKLKDVVHKMAKGELPEDIELNSKDEIGEMASEVNILIEGLKRTAKFSTELGKGNYDHSFQPLSEVDVLGNSLLNMRKSLKNTKDEDEKRKQEEIQRSWSTHGISQFNEILRYYAGNMQELAHQIIKTLILNLHANQGGFFLYNDRDDQDIYLELIATYAYNRKKYIQKKIKLGEGLIGMCALERYTMHLTEVPEEYIEIESGLGDANPKCILIIPLKIENQILGVIELASFSEFKEYEIAFIEKIAENTASTLSTLKINAKTAELLEQSQRQAREMQEQEEEMRQNIEEMQATQEETQRRERKIMDQLSLFKQQNEELKNDNLELINRVKKLEAELEQKDLFSKI